MPLAAGTHIGPYEIVAPIGKGGMGEVYRARDTKLERDVAAKDPRAVPAQRRRRRLHDIADARIELEETSTESAPTTDPPSVTISSGTHLGPYEVIAPIGVGGMRRSAKAKDTRLGRIVAFKVLPEEFTKHPMLW